MSAFEVSDTHIDALVSAALHARDHVWYHAEIPRTEPGEMLPSHPDYLASHAQMIHQLPGYSEAAWEITSPSEARTGTRNRAA